MRTFVRVAIVLVLANPTVAMAQTALASVLPDLVLREIIVPSTNPVTHVAHFTPEDPRYGTGQGSASATVSIFNNIFRQQVSTLPIGSSSGGFTYTFDPSLGTFTRRSPSFGPVFAERATTIGRGRFSIGANYQHATYDTFEGEDLGDGTIKFYIRHNDCCPNQQPSGQAGGNGSLLAPAFEGDVIEAALSLDAKTDSFGFFAQYGVTDRFDVGVAVPFIRNQLNATIDAKIIRLATAAQPLIHTFVQGQDVSEKTFSSSASASGIGDIVVRTKYNVYSSGRTGVAAAVDLRLPTGKKEDLLGTGATQAKFFAIVSNGTDRIAGHYNFGYTRSAKRDDPSYPGLDEIDYGAGAEFTPTAKLTILADVLGRTLRDAGRLKLQPQVFQFQIQDAPTPSPQTRTFNEFALESGNLNLLLGAGGFKLNVAPNLLVSANVVFPLTKNGLRDKFTTVIGFDYGF